MSTDSKRPRAWVNLGDLRQRVRDVAEMICREEGLENPRVSVRIVDAVENRPRSVEILVEEQPYDVNSSEVEAVRGYKWQDN